MRTYFYDDSFLEYGFDGDCRPPFQLIPHTDFRSVWLKNGDEMEVKSVVPNVLEIQEVPTPVKNLRIFKLQGRAVGNTVIEVRKDRRLMASLEVVVVARLTFTVTFNYVSDRVRTKDKGWQTVHQTKRIKEDLDKLIKSANRVFINQVNIEMVKHNVRDVVIDHNLGTNVGFPNDWETIIAERDKTAHLNVFFVWELDDAAGWALHRCLAVQDELGDVKPEAVLAHEIGHFLGMPDENRKQKAVGFLMSTGARIRRNEMLAMRRILLHILKLTGG